MAEADADSQFRPTLTPEEAWALYEWLESDAGPDYWETPLAPIHAQLSDWVRNDMPLRSEKRADA